MAENVPLESRHARWANPIHPVDEDKKMKEILMSLYIKIQSLLSRDEGQDLVEYALIVALIALACTAGMSSLATAINNGFSALGTTLTSDL